MRKGLMFVAGSVFGLALVATCGTKGSDFVILGDLGRALGDIAGSFGAKDAAAAAPMSAVCDKVWSSTLGTTTTKTYYAEFQVPEFDPTSPEHVTAFVCGPPANQLVPPFGCGPGMTCDAPVSGDCQGSWVHSATNGVIRVYCGFSTTTPIADYGYKWKTAYLKVGP